MHCQVEPNHQVKDGEDRTARFYQTLHFGRCIVQRSVSRVDADEAASFRLHVGGDAV